MPTTALPHAPIGVLYATRDGHTRVVAEHVAAALRARGLAAIVAGVATKERRFVLHELGMVIVAASVHQGEHEKEMVDFVREHHEVLAKLPSAFLSVSLTEATVEDRFLDLTQREKALEEVQAALARFFEETGWHPDRVLPVAGAVTYTRYGVLKRFMMKRIVAKMGGPTDTTHDHVLTDWEALDRFVAALVDHARELGAPLAPLPE